MAQLMLSKDLLKNFGKFPVPVQKKIAEFVDRFQKNPSDPGLHVHALKETMVDSKVRGANLPDGYRAIIIAPDKGDTFLLVHVDKHDNAYQWAKNKRFEVHEMTGMFQMFDVEQVDTVLHEEISGIKAEIDYPLSSLSEEELYRAGVPRPLVPAVRSVNSDEALEALSDYLPPDCKDVLYGIAAGMSLDEALEEMLGAVAASSQKVPEGPGDFSGLGERQSYDLVLVEGEEALKDILAASLEEWRVFLHPYQKKMVTWETNGAVNITGAAGTGKTVVLMHRAVHLASKLTDPKDRVLVTTFTTNLSITIKSNIQNLAPEASKRIEVTNLHALARTICRRSGWNGRIATEEECEDIWNEVWMNTALGELPMSKEELKKEYQLVIDPNGIENEDAYITTIRTGRPRISRAQRRLAWPVFLAFQRGLKKRDLMTFEGAIHQARLAVEQGKNPAYAHILVDEVQDFSLEALRLIRALSSIDGEHKDPLCMVGDGHQRIYQPKFPMSRAGIDIRGRSKRLKINYRTSEQIRKYAQLILDGVEVDDFEGGVIKTIADHSVFKGPNPELIKCKNDKDEVSIIISWVKKLITDASLKPYEICIVPFKKAIQEALNSCGHVTYELRPREMDPGKDEPGIRLGSIKRIKGLEFRAIAIACCDEHDPMNNLEQADVFARCERYVAATRAREHLLITLKK